MRRVFFALALLAAAMPARAERLLSTCDKDWYVETRTVNSAATVEFFDSGSSSSPYATRGRLECFRNNDATAANYVYVSSFTQASNPDSSKAWPIPGGNTADSVFCFPFGKGLRTFLFTATGSRTVSAFICE